MNDPSPQPTAWQPRIVAFFRNWCTYTDADLAGVSRLKYAPNVCVIRLMCSGRVDLQFIHAALCKGCGTCVASCPSGSIKQNLFEDEEIFSEIEGVLA